jgi:hypothetical protein
MHTEVMIISTKGACSLNANFYVPDRNKWHSSNGHLCDQYTVCFLNCALYWEHLYNKTFVLLMAVHFLLTGYFAVMCTGFNKTVSVRILIK